MKRYAIVRNADSSAQAARYLPGNYQVTFEADWPIYDDDPNPDSANRLVPTFVIEGEDSHGWTLDGYVIPRYASGLIFAKEIDLSHPIMKLVPTTGVHVVEPAGWVCDKHGFGPYGTAQEAAADCEAGHDGAIVKHISRV